MSFLFANAHAQEATGTAASQAPMMNFIPFILVFFVFYFLMIRPQKKKLEQEKTFLGALKKGDEVYTKSGMIGTVVGLTDTVIDLEVAQGVKVKLLKGQVADFADKLFNKNKPVESKK